MNSRGEILLNLRDDSPGINWPNQWDVIGGVVEEGETPDDCMVREMLEETGEALTDFTPFRVYEVPLLNGDAAEFHVYSARLDKPAADLVLGEGQEHRFFAVKDVAAIDLVRGIETVLRDFVSSEDYRALWP